LTCTALSLQLKQQLLPTLKNEALMDLSKEPEKVNVNGQWYYKPIKPTGYVTREQREEYNENKFAWRFALRQSTWWFEKNLQNKQKLAIAQSKGNHTRKARMKDAFVEVVDPIIVFEKDNWICQLCNKTVSKVLNRKLVDVASLDHIIPISKGGKHSYANTQLAHLSCNIKKGNRTPKV